jgi:hypothetical protein
MKALIEPWSNGQTEGLNTKLNLVKRQIYGRTSVEPFRVRILLQLLSEKAIASLPRARPKINWRGRTCKHCRAPLRPQP